MIDLRAEAKMLMTAGKGIFAADESVATANEKRLVPHGITPNEEMRRQFRDLFFSAPNSEQYLSGVILFDETLHQKSESGVLFPELLAQKGIMPGIKVDEGTEPLTETSDETITKGLIGLPERLAQYAAHGLRFTKWRAVIRIDGERRPTAHALVENAKRLAAYAVLVQRAGMVPILEPEVLYEGKHSRKRAHTVLVQTLKTVFAALEDQAADISGVIVKTSMVLSGKTSGHHDTPEEVAHDTVDALMAAVPKQVPGIVFLSGGQEPEQATENLKAVVERAREARAPWPLSFSYSRALEEEALAVWQGKEEQMKAARTCFLSRLAALSKAIS